MVCCGEQRSAAFEALMSFTDGRLLWSTIEGLFLSTEYNSKVHLCMSPMIQGNVNITKSVEEKGSSQEGLVPTWLFLPYNYIILNKVIAT